MSNVKRADQRYMGRDAAPEDVQVVSSRGSYLHQMEFGSPVDIRVTGLAIGLQFEDGDYAGALADRCRKRGLMLSADDDTLTLFPALTISRNVVHEGLDILERCL